MKLLRRRCGRLYIDCGRRRSRRRKGHHRHGPLLGRGRLPLLSVADVINVIIREIGGCHEAHGSGKVERGSGSIIGRARIRGHVVSRVGVFGGRVAALDQRGGGFMIVMLHEVLEAGAQRGHGSDRGVVGGIRVVHGGRRGPRRAMRLCAAATLLRPLDSLGLDCAICP